MTSRPEIDRGRAAALLFQFELRGQVLTSVCNTSRSYCVIINYEGSSKLIVILDRATILTTLL